MCSSPEINACLILSTLAGLVPGPEKSSGKKARQNRWKMRCRGRDGTAGRALQEATVSTQNRFRRVARHLAERPARHKRECVLSVSQQVVLRKGTERERKRGEKQTHSDTSTIGLSLSLGFVMQNTSPTFSLSLPDKPRRTCDISTSLRWMNVLKCWRYMPDRTDLDRAEKVESSLCA